MRVFAGRPADLQGDGCVWVCSRACGGLRVCQSALGCCVCAQTCVQGSRCGGAACRCSVCVCRSAVQACEDVQGFAAAYTVHVCERTCVHCCQSGSDSTGGQAVDWWVEGCVGWVWQKNIGHSVLSLGESGPLGLRGFWSTSWGPEHKVSLLCHLLFLTGPVLFSLARSSTTTWMPTSQCPRRPV